MNPFKKLLTRIAAFLLNKPPIPGAEPSRAPGVEETALASPKAGYLQSALPPYPVIWVYFTANGYPEAEALRFYRRYQLIGWNKRIVPALDHWPELADHWMRQSSQPPNRKTPKSPPDANRPGSDNSNS